MRPIRFKSRRLLHEHVYGMNPDDISRQFIRIIASNPEIDFMLCDLGGLFAVPPPKMTHDWAHHDGWRENGA